MYRFDGIRAVPWQPAGGEQLARTRIADLLVSRDNTLWITTSKGLASWKDGKFTQYPELAGQIVGPLLQDRQRTVWVGAYQPGRISAIEAGKIRCFGADKFGAGVSGLYEDRNGNLWVCSTTGLVTQNSYIKTVSADAVAAMQQLEALLSFSQGSQPGKEIAN